MVLMRRSFGVLARRIEGFCGEKLYSMTMPTAIPTLVLEPSKGFVRLNLPDVWAYRELLFFLIWRDVKVRYKQTALGAAWAILQPVMTMVVFSVFFGRLAKMPS